MVPENQTIIAILCRDEHGEWARVSSIETRQGDEAILVPTQKGLVAAVGEVREEDHPAISRDLEAIEGTAER